MAVSMGRALLGLVFVIAGTVSAAAAATSLVVLGDWGINVDVQRLVASRIASLPNRPTGVISTGDNFYYQGVADEHDAKFKSGFEDVFGQLGLPWYVTAGNHDCRGNVTGQVKYSKLNPQWNMPSRWFRRNFPLANGGTASFFFVDACILVCNPPNMPSLPKESDCTDSGTTEMAQAQLSWLALELKQLRQSGGNAKPGLDGSSDGLAPRNWVFVVTHWPLYTAGHHGDTTTMQTLLNPILRKYDVDAVFSGHDHALQHLVDDGRVHHFISGGGGYQLDKALADHRFLVQGKLAHGFITLTFGDDGKAAIRMVDVYSREPEVYAFNLPL